MGNDNTIASVNTKIILRHDTLAKWNAARDANSGRLILMDGEIALIVPDALNPSDGINYPQIKIGDGRTEFNDLKPINITKSDIVNESTGKVHASLLPDIASSNIVYIERGLGESDEDAIKRKVGENATSHGKGDIFIVAAKEGITVHSINSYIVASAPTGSTGADVWSACKSLNGVVDANKVILKDNITLAGSYDKVGNIVNDAVGKTFDTKGMSVADALQAIFTKELQPSITANPRVNSFTITNGLRGGFNVEYGTKVPNVTFSSATLEDGAYSFSQATGVKASSWAINRVATPTTTSQAVTTNITTVAGESLPAGKSDDNGAKGFIIGDVDVEGVDNIVKTLKYAVTATYGDGEIAKDNLGKVSSPAVQIKGGTASKDTQIYTGYRNFFYGTTEITPTEIGQEPKIDSALVRGCTHGGEYERKPNEINIQFEPSSPGKKTLVIFACEEKYTGPAEIINTNSMNSPILSEFKRVVVNVEGADGYRAVPYNVWYLEATFANTTTLSVKFGQINI